MKVPPLFGFRWAGLVLALLASANLPAYAQTAAPADAAAFADAADEAAAVLSLDDLKVLAARIALYPDDLVALCVSASLYPLQIVQAARFLDDKKKTPDLEPNEAELATAKQDGYFGYRYRLLTKQGANVAGGAYDYVINGNMIGGFGLVATPVKYDRTGIMTFVVNQYGTVYQKDLGADTPALADKIDAFDPDDSWTVVTDPGD
jgi:hypothetical protein